METLLTRGAWLMSAALVPDLLGKDGDIFQAASSGDAKLVSAFLDENPA